LRARRGRGRSRRTGVPQQLGSGRHRLAPTDRKEAAVDRETRDLAHRRLRHDIDWDPRRHLGEDAARLGALLRHEHRFDLKPGAGEEHPQHDLAFGDEAALASDKVALAHGAIGLEPRIARIVDRDQHGGDRRAPGTLPWRGRS
jgi:hypothetical protein